MLLASLLFWNVYVDVVCVDGHDINIVDRVRVDVDVVDVIVDVTAGVVVGCRFDDVVAFVLIVMAFIVLMVLSWMLML